MQIVKIKDSRYSEYEALLLKRDALKKEAAGCMAAYIHKFGELITAVFRKKVDCISRKKAIAFCQAAVNRGNPVDLAGLSRYVHEQTEQYRKTLAEMTENNKACRILRTVPEETALKVKQIYRRIAKLIHPDINPATDNDPVFLELWRRIDAAYHANDLEEMEELEILVAAALRDLGQEDREMTIPDIGEKIDKLNREIQEIITTDPYRFKDLLSSRELCDLKRRELEDELAEYEAYDSELKKVMQKLAVNGAEITWEMN